MILGGTMRDINYCVTAHNLKKKYKKFTLDIENLAIPEGFATALIGENGAGKSTLMNFLSGIRLDFDGEIEYFGKYSNEDAEKESCPLRELTGYTGTGNYYLPQWTIKQVADISEILFDNFHKDKFYDYVREFRIDPLEGKKSPKVSTLSDGNLMKLEIAGVLARDTNLLILDEPASPLDPLSREELCDRLREYIDRGNGRNSVSFSTHNISDMESVTDYAIIMHDVRIVEEGFTEDLKEKYISVKGDPDISEAVRPYLYTENSSKYGIEGIALADKADSLAGFNLTLERPTLSQIAVAILKHERN